MHLLCLQRRSLSVSHTENHRPLVIGNPADSIRTPEGLVTLYIPEFSRPTGRYINKIFLSILNRLVRSGSVAIAGNPCTPGLGIMKELSAETAEIILNKSKQRTVIVNCRSCDNDIKGIAFQAEPFMTLHLRDSWQSMDDYLAAMHSKYRVRAKKALHESSNLKSTIYRGREIPVDLFPVMADLLSKTLSKKTIALPYDLNRLLKSFANQFGNEFEVQIYEYENRAIGFLSRVYLPSGAYGMHIGYEGRFAKQLHIYQRMMLDLIERAIVSDSKSVNMGRTATEIKSTLGAEPDDNYFVLLSRNPLMRLAAQMYKKLFFKSAQFIIRQPFKN